VQRQSPLQRCQRIAGVVLAIIIAMAVTPLLAALPVVDQLSPLGVVRGQETVVTFRGVRLGDAHQVLVDLPGITILEVKPIDEKSVEVKLRTEPTLSPGLYPVRLVTKSGIANLRLLGVGTMPITPEVEPNNEFATPQKIELNTTVEGVVTSEDVDHFSVELAAGQTLNVEVEGIRLHYTLNQQNILDPYIAILDAGRFEVATSDDSSLLQQDGVCSFTAPQDGSYTVLLRDSSFGGSAVCGYRLHIGTFPRPIAVLPAGGAPGSILTGKLLSIDGSVADASVQLPSEPHDAWPVVTENEQGTSPSPNWIRVNDLPIVSETEPNNSQAEGTPATVPAAFCGVIEAENDFDFFTFDCKAGEKFRVHCFSRNIMRSPLDAVMHVFGPDGKALTGADDVGRNPDPLFEFTAAVDGQHAVRVYDHLRSGSAAHHYRVEVRAADPGFTVGLNELRRYEAEVVSVPIGGQTATMVNVTRAGYGGEVRYELAGLPAGVTATTFPIPAGRSEAPVLLSAAPDAVHNASLFRIDGRGDDANAHVTGVLSQTHNLVLGQNRVPMWTYDTTHAAMAVTDAAPFSIELVQPATPLLREGSKELTVRIVRNEGFEQPVSLRTLYNPPGIGVNNSLKIEKDQTEVNIPITANGGAGIGVWPMILVASYDSGKGTADATTPAIMLDVQDSLFKYEFPKAAAEQGAEASIAVVLQIQRDLPGEAEIELAGLPNGVTSPSIKQKIAPDATSVVFPLTIAADAKVGSHKTLVCIARVTVGDETIVQTTGTGELRIDPPPPPKADPPPAPAEAAPATPPPPAEPKPLSRLEQLRQSKNQ
jgi:hypothetical protein